jgi:hypothetical protein
VILNVKKPQFTFKIALKRQFSTFPIAVDASDVREKGRSGRIYRLHYALDVFKMSSVEHKITTNKVGESLCNFTFKPGDLVIADRSYANSKA